MNQLAGRLLLGGAMFLLGGCSDDDGIDILPKGQPAVAGSDGGGAGGSAGTAGSGDGGSGGGGSSGGVSLGGSGGSSEPPDSGPPEDSCTPVFLDGGVVSDAGADAGDAGAVSSNGPLSFAADIHPILRGKCVPCHETDFSGGHNVAAADVTEAYGFVKDIKGSLVAKLSSGEMPPPPDCNGVPGDPGCISLAELDLIKRWAAQCFPP